MRPSLRPWAAIAVGAVAVAGLTGFVHAAAPAGEDAVPGPPQTITYELSGDEPTTREIYYGDVADLNFSPWAATALKQVSLPWSVTVPLSGPLSTHDLLAWTTEHSTITCTVRRNGLVVSTGTSTGGAFCDTPPG